LEGDGSIPAWEYDLQVHDFALNEGEKEEDRSYEPPPDFDVFFSVRFPHEDLAAVLKRLRRHNRRYPDSKGAYLKLSR
jgi:hypothetical protein